MLDFLEEKWAKIPHFEVFKALLFPTLAAMVYCLWALTFAHSYFPPIDKNDLPVAINSASDINLIPRTWYIKEWLGNLWFLLMFLWAILNYGMWILFFRHLIPIKPWLWVIYFILLYSGNYYGIPVVFSDINYDYLYFSFFDNRDLRTIVAAFIPYTFGKEIFFLIYDTTIY